jgi:hypothetical protein
MNYIFESIFVGLYTCIIYFIVRIFANKNILLFVTGFMKHFVGYYIGLHEEYCNYKKNSTRRLKIKKNIIQISMESFFEGIVFFSIGLFFKKNYSYLLLFSIACGLHIFAELIGIHKYFCKYS